MVTGSAHNKNRRHIDNSDKRKYSNSSDYKMIGTGDNVPINFFSFKKHVYTIRTHGKCVNFIVQSRHTILLHMYEH